MTALERDLKGNGKERRMVKTGMRMRCRKKRRMLLTRMKMIVEVVDVMGMKRKCRNRKMVGASLALVTVVMVLGGMVVLVLMTARKKMMEAIVEVMVVVKRHWDAYAGERQRN